MSLALGVWWQIYPLGAVGADQTGKASQTEPARRSALPEVAWLDYVAELGCTGLLLNPIFTSVTHGYDTLDHFTIDPRIGTESSFSAFMEACRERDLHVLLDGVFNHVSDQHKFLTEQSDMVRWVDGHPWGWEGNADLVELDHSNPAVLDFVVEVMLFWLRRGIAGWRLDVAYAVPTEFWKAAVERVRAEFPEAIFIGEVIHGDYADFVEASTLNTVTQYELWKGIWSSLKDSNPWELGHALERHADFCDTFVPQTFVSNHDVTRIATQVGEVGAALAAGILLTVPGSPSIYYGDERALTGEKYERLGGDEEIRPALPSSPAEFTDGAEMFAWYQELIAFRKAHPWISTGHLEVTEKSDEYLSFTVTARLGEVPADGPTEVHVNVNYKHHAFYAAAGDAVVKYSAG